MIGCVSTAALVSTSYRQVCTSMSLRPTCLQQLKHSLVRGRSASRAEKAKVIADVPPEGRRTGQQLFPGQAEPLKARTHHDS
jgi:hypothetical protein